jgi:hypothetical protein
MSHKEEFALDVKAWIYVIGIIALLTMSTMEYLHAYKPLVNHFWPPDMVPHPHCPEPKNGGDQASI